MTGDLFGDAGPARSARDKGLQSAARNIGQTWMGGAIQRLLSIPYQDFTGEDVRNYLLSRDYPKPHHHNVWGAVMMEAAKRGLIVKTGEWRQMKNRKSHARATPVYRLASRKE